ncbi:MAG: hypothetical protein NVS4B11_21560 [Ktedonobacteraceae bacterium]
MRTQSADTHPDIERVQIELLRKTPLAKRFAMIESWSQFIIEAARQGIHQDDPSLSEQEIALVLVARQYGQVLADKVRAKLDREE